MSTPIARSPMRAALPRATGFLALWLVLTQGNPADIPAGMVTAAAATWTSLRLLPPSATSLSLLALAKFTLRFFRQSIVAGVDVAGRALDPKLPLRTGFVVYPSTLAAGPARSTFCTVASLLPGTLPAETSANGDLIIHCLDVNQEVVSGLTRDEDLFKEALGARMER